MSKPAVSHAKIQKVQADAFTETDDLLAAEEPLEIRLGYGPADAREQKSISVTMRTPGHDFELALGFLYTEGIIQSASAISQIRYCTDVNTIENKENIIRAELRENVPIDFGKLQRNFYTTSSCGVCGKASIEAIQTICPLPSDNDSQQWTVNQNIILSLPQKLRQHQNVFEYTGGLHACALFDLKGNIELVREDVGRHNALDKLIGAALGADMLPLQEHIVLLSGRASFELLQKAAMAGIKMICAVGAPSSLAVETAKAFNITLVGFLRDNRFNIYSYPQRVKL